MEEKLSNRANHASKVSSAGLLFGCAVYCLMKLWFHDYVSAGVGGFLGVLFIFPFTPVQRISFPRWLCVAVLVGIVLSLSALVPVWLSLWLPEPIAFGLVLFAVGLGIYWLPSLSSEKFPSISFGAWALSCGLLVLFLAALNSLKYMF
ncbi:MAG TPA: hypothetical protein VF525_08020 [Pyrinomonadaceae bacterium]